MKKLTAYIMYIFSYYGFHYLVKNKRIFIQPSFITLCINCYFFYKAVDFKYFFYPFISITNTH